MMTVKDTIEKVVNFAITHLNNNEICLDSKIFHLTTHHENNLPTSTQLMHEFILNLVAK